MATSTPHLDPDLLSAYLDDEVTAAERAQVDTHLASCAGCRAELEGLRRTVSLLQAMPVVPPPRTFYVTEAMIEPAPSTSRRWWDGWRQWVGGLATVAALLLFMIVVQTQGRSAMSPAAVEQESAAGAAAPAEATGEPEIAMSQERQATESAPGAPEDAAGAELFEATTVPPAANATSAASGVAESGALSTATVDAAAPPIAPVPEGTGATEGGGGESTAEGEESEEFDEGDGASATPLAEGGESAEEPIETMTDSATISPTLPGPVATASEDGVLAMAEATPDAVDAAPPAPTPVPQPTLFSPEALPFLALALLLLLTGGAILWRTRGNNK